MRDSNRDDEQTAQVMGSKDDPGGTMIAKFTEMGLDPKCSAEEKVWQLWQLYCKSEASLKASLEGIAVLRQQQQEEVTQFEAYMENVKQQNALLRERANGGGRNPETTEMLLQQGLEDIAEASPAEQIAYLLVERARLFDELAALEEEGVPGVVITPAGPLTAEELHAVLLRERAEWEEERQEMQRGKLSLSDERKEARIVALEREVEKLGKQVVEVKRENECLRLERDSLMEKGIEEREKVQAKMEEMLLIERRETDILKSDKEEMQVALADAEDRISGLEKQRDDSDMLLRKFREGRPAGAVGDPANCQQLQMEVEALQHEVARLVDKCERQQRRYDERRERTREKLQKARDAAYSEKGSLQSEVLSMQSEIALLRATLEKDSDWEEHLHDDHQRALLEKRDLLTQLADQEEAMRDNTRKMAMLQLHCKFMEDQNSALQLRLHAYITRQSNSRLPDRVITDSYRPGLVQTLTQDVDSTSTHTPDPQLLRHRARMDSGDDDVSYADVVSRGEDHFPLAAAKDEIIDM